MFLLLLSLTRGKCLLPLMSVSKGREQKLYWEGCVLKQKQRGEGRREEGRETEGEGEYFSDKVKNISIVSVSK